MINSRAFHTIQVTGDWAPWLHRFVSTDINSARQERSMRHILALIMSVSSILICYNVVAFNTANAKPM